MTATKPLAAPFPYFGGKRRAARIVWGALGDPAGYVEPFAGSAAVLLARADFSGRRVETLNDATPPKHLVAPERIPGGWMSTGLCGRPHLTGAGWSWWRCPTCARYEAARPLLEVLRMEVAA